MRHKNSVKVAGRRLAMQQSDSPQASREQKDDKDTLAEAVATHNANHPDSQLIDVTGQLPEIIEKRLFEASWERMVVLLERWSERYEIPLAMPVAEVASHTDPEQRLIFLLTCFSAWTDARRGLYTDDDKLQLITALEMNGPQTPGQLAAIKRMFRRNSLLRRLIAKGCWARGEIITKH